MNKYISVSKEGVRALQRTFKVKGKEICERVVKNALAYRTDNELARKIRFAALKHHYGCTYYVLEEGEFFSIPTAVGVRSIPMGQRFISTSRQEKVWSTDPKEMWSQNTTMSYSRKSTKSRTWRQPSNPPRQWNTTADINA